jgi:quercetin dioxygenase-like cupin family protein
MTTLPHQAEIDPNRISKRDGFLHPDGTLRLVEWATHVSPQIVDTPIPMAATEAMAAALVTNGYLGVDLINVPDGGGFAPHTHPGDHLLIIIRGEGTITYEGRIYATRAGQVYLIEGAVPHAVGGLRDHAILAVGAPHRLPDSPERMALVEYCAIATDLGHLHCLICDIDANVDDLAEVGCPHSPSRWDPNAGHHS